MSKLLSENVDGSLYDPALNTRIVRKFILDGTVSTECSMMDLVEGDVFCLYNTSPGQPVRIVDSDGRNEWRVLGAPFVSNGVAGIATDPTYDPVPRDPAEKLVRLVLEMLREPWGSIQGFTDTEVSNSEVMRLAKKYGVDLCYSDVVKNVGETEAVRLGFTAPVQP